MTTHPPAQVVAPSGVLDPYLPGHGNRGYAVTRYELDLDYKVAANRLIGHARVHATATARIAKLRLDLAGLRVSAVLVDGRAPRRYTHRAGKLTVWFAAPLEPASKVVIDVRYAGNPRPIIGTWGEVGWEELTDGVIVAGQPDGAASWFPCNDHPSNKASCRLTITTDPGYTVVASGSMTEHTSLATRVRWTFEQPEPMATYLATVQIGRYTSVETAAGPVPQRAAVPNRLVPTFLHDFGRQSEMMTVFQDLFGPFPFPAYTVVVADDVLEMPLEAQGISVFGTNHLDGRRGSQRLVAHELAHQWFGNSLTLSRWQDIWLHEGFACYAEWLWSEHSGGPSAQVLAERAWNRLVTLPQDLLVGDPGPQLMFDDRVYKRGALTLHALRVAIGDTGFFDALRAWTSTRAHGNVTTRDLVEVLAQHTEVPLDAIVDAWLFRAPLPRLVGHELPAPRTGSRRRKG